MVGAAGKLFTEVLRAAGVVREEVLVTNTVRCRPPRNKIANWPDAPDKCRRWTVEELSTYNPRVVVLVGASAAKLVFGKNAKMQDIRGVFRQTSPDFEYGARIWTATWHPAAALHAPDKRAIILQQMVDDIKSAKELLCEL